MNKTSPLYRKYGFNRAWNIRRKKEKRQEVLPVFWVIKNAAGQFELVDGKTKI